MRKHQRRAGSAGSGVALQPLVDRLRALLLQRQVLHADETPSAATRSRRGENQTPLYLSLLWAYRSNDLEPSDSRGLAAHRRSLCPRLARPRTRRGRPAAAA
ncbi:MULTISPECIES: IS66 family transposase [Stutzerimonas stutzeri subgroup]|uniref:IS66 family transposase n=1 Tax=Stutzerimonas stutzeri subgroup TaxID=578833 RepID=UPI0015E36AE6|nr:transposase [Pseudomonas aeruginosa]